MSILEDMSEAARTEWERYHGGMDPDDIPQMNPSFWRGFLAGAGWAKSHCPPAVEEPEERL